MKTTYRVGTRVYVISFKDNNSITRYIFNETQYDKVIPIIESII